MTDNELKLMELDKTVRENEIVRQINEKRRIEIEKQRIADFDRMIDGSFANIVNEVIDSPEVNDKIEKEIGKMSELAERAIVFDTIADMKASTHIKVDMTARTNGFHEIGDGGAAWYQITAVGVPNDMDCFMLGNGLYAKLTIVDPYVTPEMFGAWGDGEHDDVSYIKAAIKYLVDNNSSGWRTSAELRLNAHTYLVSDSIIDSTMFTGATRIMIMGNGTRSTIKASESCLVMFNNDNLIGFSNFIDISFVGNDSTFLFETGSQPQRLRFERCNFSNFHTIADIEGSVDNSEFVFSQCAIKGCGSSDNNCELFIFNNSQAVNWRFYATDIETFVGTCFHFKKGTSINFFQGSIIPVDGLVFSYAGADPNHFGQGNLPTVVMYGVRYELRNSRLIDADFHGRVAINHISCGMGGYNIGSDGGDTIKLINCSSQLIFNNCYNWENYIFHIEYNRSANINKSTWIKFYDCDYDLIQSVMNNSVFTTLYESYRDNMPIVYFDGQPIKSYYQSFLSASGKILGRSNVVIGDYQTSINNAGTKMLFPRSGFVTSVTLESIYTTKFGSNAEVIAEIYNASNSLIGTATVKVQSRSKSVIQINEEVTTDWYVILKNTYSSTSIITPHILYAEYL